MPYATRLDLENAYGETLIAKLADHDGDGVPEDEAIDDALEAATSIIDAHISARYTVPVDPVTHVVKDLAIDIALYRLAYSRLKQTDEMRLRYEDAINLLKRIADGKATIGVDVVDGSGDGDGSGGPTDGSGGGVSGDSKFTARTRWLLRA
jgi:phage gp36-like protein